MTISSPNLQLRDTAKQSITTQFPNLSPQIHQDKQFTTNQFPNLSPLIHQDKQSITKQFQNWSKQNPKWMNALENIPEESKYKRFNYKVFKNQQNSPIIMLSINATNGDIYMDNFSALSTSTDSRSTLMGKHLGCILLRPIEAVINTLWHATISILLIKAYKYYKGQNSIKTIINIWNSCRDTVRTPLYGIVMTIAHIAAVIIGTFYPSSVYHFREWIGNKNLELHYLKKNEKNADKRAFMFAPCFTPIGNISTLYTNASALDVETNKYKTHKIDCNQNTIKNGLTNLAEGTYFVKALREEVAKKISMRNKPAPHPRRAQNNLVRKK